MNYLPFLDPAEMIPVSRFSTEVFKTGSWSRSRPVFEEKNSPCNAACPTANNIPAALYRASVGDYDGALAAFLEESPLPSVCGRVCSHSCQSRCNRGDHDSSVSIRALERAASEFGSARAEVLSDAGREFPVAVIGSGPAGLAAAYHLARLGHRVTLLEERDRLGGLLAGGIPRYRLPQEALERDLQRILALGIEVRTGQPVDDALLEKLRLSHRSVLLATGAWAPKRMGVSGEDLGGVLKGLDFLLDEAQQAEVQGRRVVVIGGGNTAIDAARVALRRGAATVSILYRPDMEALPECDDEVREAADEGIARGPAHPDAFLGVGGRVTAVRCKETAQSCGQDGVLICATGAAEIPCDIVITAIGQTIRQSSLHRFVTLGADRIVVDDCGRSGRQGLYACGDAATARGTVVEAMAGGKAAALTIHLDLTGRGGAADASLFRNGFSIKAFFQEGTPRPHGVVAEVSGYSYLTAAAIPGQIQPSQPPSSRIRDFGEVTGGLGSGQATLEAGRCFFCGTCIGCDLCASYCPDVSMGRVEGKTAYASNPDYCKGCGACAAVCVRGVLAMGDEP